MAPSTEDEWKSQPPYKKPDESFDRKLQGTCHCGKVKYWLSRDKPLSAKNCHCHTCQTVHGAPYQWAAIIHKEDLAFENGADGLRWYNTSTKNPEHELPCKVSCSFCGSFILDEGRNMLLLFPPLIKFGNEATKKKWDATSHIFYPQRVVDIPDGKVKWSGLEEQSEELDEK